MTPNNAKEVIEEISEYLFSTIIFIIFQECFLFCQIFLEALVKRSEIISNKHRIYALPNDLNLKILRI